MQTARSKKIADYIKAHGSQRVKDQSVSVYYGGKLHRHSVYYIPIEGYLIHNIRNGRFRSELLQREEALRRKLDPNKKQDDQEIRKLLTDINKNETDALRADIMRYGQLEPGIITFDGAVINANRRMAIVRDLYDETKEDKYKYLMVAVLEEGVDEIDLWRIEAGLQFGRDFRLQYGGVNELLKLREGQKGGLTPADISKALLGRFSEKQVVDKLEILKLIDSYLSFINKKGEYQRISELGDLEKFNSLYASISPLKRNEEKKKHIPDVTAVGFALIDRANITHWDIRELKDVYFDDKAKQELLTPFKKGIPYNTKEIKSSSDSITEAFKTAQDVIGNRKDETKPHRLLKRALSALEGIDEKKFKSKDPESKALIKQIEKRVSALVAAISKS